MMARARSPLVVVISGALRSACLSDSQFPERTPIDLARFTRLMPAAGSGASRPLSVAATGGVRMVRRAASGSGGGVLAEPVRGAIWHVT